MKSAIIIGVGNTIIRSGNAWKYLLSKLDIADNILIIFRDKYIGAAQKGIYSKDELIGLFSKTFNKSKKEIIEAFTCGKSKLSVNKGLISFLSRLQDKGHKVVLITNTTAFFSSFGVEKELYKKFTTILSFKVGVRMPDIKMYKEALKKIRVKADDCIYIDAKEERLFPAKKLGMKTILFKDNKQVKKELDRIKHL